MTMSLERNRGQKMTGFYDNVTSDGKRGLVGLSQKIREKAWHSTSIDSDCGQDESFYNAKEQIESNNRGYHGNYHNATMPHVRSDSNKLEDRLRLLLPSDIESQDEDVIDNWKKKIAGSHTAQYSSQNTQSLRSYREHVKVFGNFRRSSMPVNSMELGKRLNGCLNPRRCESAIPASFNQNWNIVPDSHVRCHNKSSSLHIPTPRPRSNVNVKQTEAWNQRPMPPYEYFKTGNLHTDDPLNLYKQYQNEHGEKATETSADTKRNLTAEFNKLSCNSLPKKLMKTVIKENTENSKKSNQNKNCTNSISTNIKSEEYNNNCFGTVKPITNKNDISISEFNSHPIDDVEDKFSRSGTPVLPPLSPLLSEEEENAIDDSNKNLNTTNEDFGHEMSPTESALDTLETTTSESKSNQNGNNDSNCECKKEKKERKTRHHRRHRHHQSNRKNKSPSYVPAVVYYDDTNLKTAKIRSDNYPRSAVDVFVDQHEITETASVHSYNSQSVSSVVRKSTRRHHRNTTGILIGQEYEKGIRAVNKRFSRLEGHVVTLARSVAQLSVDVNKSDTMTKAILDLQQQIQQVRDQQTHNCVTPRDSTQPKRYLKLKKFFGEQPPVLHFFLKDLGYEEYISKFDAEKVGILELPYMTEERLSNIGIPLGPRIRILEEAKKYSFR